MAGGQATNSGIDYQQRVAAWCLVNQYSEFDISAFFDQIDDDLVIEVIRFETSDNVDDLCLICKNYKQVFLQIKRSLSLSIRDSSDFYKTIRQFVLEFIKNENTINYFGLVTTNDASGKIRNDLKKIVSAIRINEDSFNDNPLNESEKDTFDKIDTLFSIIYEELKGVKPSKKQFYSFLKRVFVAVVDVEAGKSVEIASLMLLKSIGFNNPELIWSILIKNSLYYATERMSINKIKLEEIFSKYLGNQKDGQVVDNSEIVKTKIVAEGSYSAGKEVVFIESFLEEVDYMIVELYRFSDDCQLRSGFYDNKIMMMNGDEFTIIQRFATMVGFDRFMEENAHLYKDKRIAFVPANDIDNVDDTECATLHKKYMDNLVLKNENILLCLHCGKQIGDDNALLVEIEDKGTLAAVGNVHKVCVRPVDRILGVTKIPGKSNKSIDGFDFKTWVSLMLKGQGMLNSLKSSPQLSFGRTPIIAWNSNEEYDSEYSYCVKFILEDGSTSYSYKRSRIERLNKIQAQQHVELFGDIQKKQIEKKDPWCVLSMSKQAAPYSELLKMKKDDGEVILEIVRAEVAKYSKLVAKVFDKNIFHYAPMCIVRNKEYETILNLINVVPFISDPLHFSDFCNNWIKMGFEIDADEVELKIIKSDKDFDYYMRMVFADNKIPIIDPLFDGDFKLISGYPINELNRMIEKMSQENDIDDNEDNK